MFTLLVQIKLVAKTVQTNAKKTTLIIHFHSALDKVVFGVYKRVPSFFYVVFLKK